MSSEQHASVGLVLMGGGARAAYQVGVLKGIVDVLASRPQGLKRNPFSVICGTSAGAINATALACRAHDVQTAIEDMVTVWRDFKVEQVYESDVLSIAQSGARWLSMLAFGWVLQRFNIESPLSLLNNAPLRVLLTQLLDFKQLDKNIKHQHLSALAVTASGYNSGQHLTFYQSLHEIKPWRRTRRSAMPTKINVDHLLASSAIPFVFPPTPLLIGDNVEWCGDGSMRQLSPVSPAIHLGASKVLVIGAGQAREVYRRGMGVQGYPSLAQIAGHTLSNIFLDGLAADVERLERVNHTLALLPEAQRLHTDLRRIDVLHISPHQDLDRIAAQHIRALPAMIRALLHGVGVGAHVSDLRGSALASYLLFESAYTSELIELGIKDSLRHRHAILNFFNGADAAC